MQKRMARSAARPKARLFENLLFANAHIEFCCAAFVFRVRTIRKANLAAAAATRQRGNAPHSVETVRLSANCSLSQFLNARDAARLTLRNVVLVCVARVCYATKAESRSNYGVYLIIAQTVNWSTQSNAHFSAEITSSTVHCSSLLTAHARAVFVAK